MAMLNPRAFQLSSYLMRGMYSGYRQIASDVIIGFERCFKDQIHTLGTFSKPQHPTLMNRCLSKNLHQTHFVIPQTSLSYLSLDTLADAAPVHWRNSIRLQTTVEVSPPLGHPTMNGDRWRSIATPASVQLPRDVDNFLVVRSV